jgi:hypothetical protein
MSEESIYQQYMTNRNLVTTKLCHKKEKGNEDIAFIEDDILPSEKWLVAFEKNLNSGFSSGPVFFRQFYAPGFYEAYDIVATYSEKLQVKILWFQEKRNCGLPFTGGNYPDLESLCTYCNNFFNYRDPIPCPDAHCTAELCSRQCLQDHATLRHK